MQAATRLMVGDCSVRCIVYHLLYRGNNNKSAQSNLRRGPRRGTVAHVRRKVPLVTMARPKFGPQKYPFPSTDPQTPLSSSSLDPSDL